jgi:hypothetical protein
LTVRLIVKIRFRDGIEAKTASFSPKVIILIEVFKGVKSAAFEARLPALGGVIVVVLCKKREIKVL